MPSARRNDLCEAFYFFTGVTTMGSTGVSTAGGVCCCWQDTNAAAVRARTVMYFISVVFLGLLVH